MINLKPCAHCGGTAQLEEFKSSSLTDRTEYHFRVSCSDCVIGADVIKPLMFDTRLEEYFNQGIDDRQDSKMTVIDVWNKRI